MSVRVAKVQQQMQYAILAHVIAQVYDVDTGTSGTLYTLYSSDTDTM